MNILKTLFPTAYKKASEREIQEIKEHLKNISLSEQKFLLHLTNFTNLNTPTPEFTQRKTLALETINNALAQCKEQKLHWEQKLKTLEGELK